MKNVSLGLVIASLCSFVPARAISLDDIQSWTGLGINRAALVVEWSSPESLTNSSVPVPVTDKTMAWGYRFNGASSGTQMLEAIIASDPRLYVVADVSFGIFVEGIGYNFKNNGNIGITDGTITNAIAHGLLTNATVNMDAARPINAGDLYWGGYFGPNWETWNELGGQGGLLASPNRGTNSFWTADDPNAPYAGVHGQWQLAEAGLDSLSLTNGSWIGFSVTAGEYEPELSAPYNVHKHAPPSPDGTYMAYVPDTNDFAIQIVSTNSIYATAPYNDPIAILGFPASRFLDYFGDKTLHRSKIIEPPYWTAPDGANVLAEINKGGQATVKLGRKIYDDPNNPYGVDLIVFGNSFFGGSGLAGDGSDLDSLLLGSGIFGHPTMVSVSQDGTNWYAFTNTSTLFPDNAYRWDEINHSWTDEPLNPTRPINPAIYGMDFGGQPAANLSAEFNGSAGGSGYDLKESGFPWIQFVRIEPGAESYTVIDAIAGVNPAVAGDSLSITPGNLASGVTTLRFQKPSDPGQNLISIQFSSLNGIAKLNTFGLSDLSSFPPVSGNLSCAFELSWKSLLGNGEVEFVADLSLRVGDSYSGDGSDLRVSQYNGTNWVSKPFTFSPGTLQVSVRRLTNFSAFAVTQIASPRLSVQTVANGLSFQFAPLSGYTNIFERSSDLIHWSVVQTFNPPSPASVILQDPNPPADNAFYRLRLNAP